MRQDRGLGIGIGVGRSSSSLTDEVPTAFPVWDKSPYLTSDSVALVEALRTNRLKGSTPTVSTITASVGTSGWNGGTVAPNGNIYFPPGSATQIAKLNPTTDTFSLVGPVFSTATQKYICGVLAPNGYIYFIPNRAGNVLKLNPATDVVTQITAGFGNGAFNGAILSPQGVIYGVPQTVGVILRLDTATDIITAITPPTVNVIGNKWCGAALAADGKIYMIPGSANAVLELDPATDAMTTYVVYDTALRNQYQGTVLGPNGLLYGIPNESFQVMIFNPVTKTASFVSTLGGGGYMYGGAMGPDGVIYMQGWANNSVMGFDTITNQKTMYYPAGKPTSGIWYGGGGVMALNGAVYLPANNTTQVFTKITFSGTYSIDSDWPLSRQVNHF
jgi:streptogramin lyase